jgi:arginine decarboxylase
VLWGLIILSHSNKKARAPLYDQMLLHHSQNHTSFHVPGHKNGAGIDPKAHETFAPLLSMDYTEIASLDDLHRPEGVIKEAQQLAAACFGAEQSFFLVNGSTVGNLAMILTVCAFNDILIVQRNVHKSIIHGLMLAGAKVVFLPPRWDEASGLATGVNLKDVIQAMIDYPAAKGVLLSNPNYHGMGIALADIAKAVHANGMPLLIDEAHGAHYGFHPRLPGSALSSGADIVVQSTHKMLTAMTMGAMLHVQGNRVDRDILQQRLGMLQSSSPSYPIMASLDLCRRWMDTEGERSLDSGLRVIDNLHQQISLHLPYIGVLKRDKDTSSYDTLDPFKITIHDRSGTYTGYQLRDKLGQAGCDAEMADVKHVLLHLSFASTNEDVDRLIKALLDIFTPIRLKKQDISQEISNNNSIPPFSQISAPITMQLPQQRVSANVKAIPLKQALGYRAAEMVIPYPPGIPILYYGELITGETITYLQLAAKEGATFQGTKDISLTDILVFNEK